MECSIEESTLQCFFSPGMPLPPRHSQYGTVFSVVGSHPYSQILKCPPPPPPPPPYRTSPPVWNCILSCAVLTDTVMALPAEPALPVWNCILSCGTPSTHKYSFYRNSPPSMDGPLMELCSRQWHGPSSYPSTIMALSTEPALPAWNYVLNSGMVPHPTPLL